MLRSLLTATACLGLLTLLLGCGRGAPPKAIATADIPEESQTLFGQAPAAVKELAANATAALVAQDWASAWVGFQTLSERKDLTREQREFVGSSIMAIGAEMQRATEQGDLRSEAAQQIHRISK